MTMTPPAPGLRPGLHRLSLGLLVYGTIGLVLAGLGLVALLWVGGRLESLAERASVQVDKVALTLDDTATVLADASASATSFAGTLTRTKDSIQSAAGQVGSVQAKLTDLEAQFRGIEILGNQPLGKAADVIAEISTTLDGLDVRLQGIATSLDDNRVKLESNAVSLQRLGVRVADLADELRSGVVEDSLADVRAIVLVTVFVLTAWTAVPAVGALVLGLWLRRQLGPPTARPRTQ